MPLPLTEVAVKATEVQAKEAEERNDPIASALRAEATMQRELLGRRSAMNRYLRGESS